MSDGLVLAVDTATDSVVAGVAALHAGEVRVLAERAVADLVVPDLRGLDRVFFP